MMGIMKPQARIAIDHRLTLTVSGPASTTLGVRLNRATAAQLADLLDHAVQLDTRGQARGAVFGELVAEPDAVPVKPAQRRGASR